MAYYYNPTNSALGAQQGTLYGNELYSGWESLGQGWQPLIASGAYPDMQQIRALFPDGNVPQQVIDEILSAQSAWKTANPAPTGMSYSGNQAILPSSDQIAWDQGYGNFDLGAQSPEWQARGNANSGGFINSLMSAPIGAVDPIIGPMAEGLTPLGGLLQFATMAGGAGALGGIGSGFDPTGVSSGLNDVIGSGFDPTGVASGLAEIPQIQAIPSIPQPDFSSGIDSVANAAAQTGTGGNMSFFSDILGDYESQLADVLAQSGSTGSSGLGEWENQLSQVLAQGVGTGSGGYGEWESQLADVLAQGGASGTGAATTNIPDWLKSMLGTADMSGLTGAASGMMNDLFSKDTMNKAIASAPFLAAIGYAKDLGDPDLSGMESSLASLAGDGYSPTPIDTSRLQSIYSQFDPAALTGQYDLATGAGRNALTSNLARRGVMGSSFGNFDLGSYDTSRDVGRRALLNAGLTSQAGVANQIASADTQTQAQALQAAGLTNQRLGLSANVSNEMVNAKLRAAQLRNDLYGRGLYGLASVLSPKSSFSFTG